MEKRKRVGFFFQVAGEQVVDARPNLDYTVHRGIEELVETQTLEERLAEEYVRELGLSWNYGFKTYLRNAWIALRGLMYFQSL